MVKSEWQPFGLAERIKEVAWKKRMSIRELAEAADISKRTLEKVIYGAEPGVSIIVRLCIAHDLSADWLLFGRTFP